MKRRNKEPPTHPAVERAFQEMFKLNQPKDQKDEEDSMENIEKEDHFNFKVSTQSEGQVDLIKEVKKNIINNFGEIFAKMK